MSEPPIVPAGICRRCGASNPLDAAQCWLCSREGRIDPYAVSPQPQMTGTGISHTQARSQNIYAVLLCAAVGLSLMIGIGIATIDPGFLVAYVIIIAPAFLATGARLLYGTVRHEQTKPSALLTAFVTGLSFILVLGLLAIAVLVALFLWCVMAMGIF